MSVLPLAHESPQPLEDDVDVSGVRTELEDPVELHPRLWLLRHTVATLMLDALGIRELITYHDPDISDESDSPCALPCSAPP